MPNRPIPEPGTRWHSLRWRLPLAISLVVTTIIAVVLGAAYREVKSALIASGVERARGASAQVATIMGSSLRMGALRNAAVMPVFRDYLETPRPEQLEAVNAALRKLQTGTGPRTITFWDAGSTRVAEVAISGSPTTRGPSVLPPPNEAPRTEGLQPLGAAEDSVFLEAVVAIRAAPTAPPIGFLVTRGPLVINPPGLFSRLVGDNASVLLGNRDGSLWVDLGTLLRTTGPVQAEDEEPHRDGDVGALSELTDAPFLVWVGFQQTALLAPAQRFLQRMLLLGLIAALASAVLVRAFTVTFTLPLAQLTAATEAVAAGDYTRRLNTGRRDEVGRLGRAFDAMTSRLARDVTIRAEAARALRENEERLRYTLSAARVGIWQVSLDTGVMGWSETMGPLFGVESSALPSTVEEAIALVHPDDRGRARASLIREASDELEHELFFRALQPNGDYRWMVGRSRQVTDGGHRRLLGVCMDVTEQKQLEDQLRQAQKMDAIGKLAGGIAHDFNNLLTAILGFGNLLLESTLESDPRHTHLEQILKAARRAADLTAQLLAFSRHQLLQPVVIDVNQAVEDSVVLFRRLIGENIRLETILAPDGATVRADPVQLQQVLMNLAINARDAMPEGGTLTIEAANVELDEHYGDEHYAVAPGPYVRIAVTDTGVGMTEAVRARLFEPFFTTKKRGEGTGLGLATVYGAVKQAGGYIWAYGEPGKGSTFKVYLPRVDGESATPVVSAAAPSPARGDETILLVEDEAAVRMLATMMLERAGYRIIQAGTAEEAETTHLAHAGSIRLLITDVVLPGSSGPDLFQRLSIRDPKLKVLYMSGYTDDAVFRTGRLQHGVAFVQKPFTAETLRKKTREVLDD